MRIYVAGRTTDVPTVRAIAEALEDDGHTITFKWYDPTVGEIRHDSLKSSDLRMVVGDSGVIDEKVEGEGWRVSVEHRPSGERATGEGINPTAAHDVAVNKLRAKLNAGWSNAPDKARKIATAEIAGVATCDAVVLIWAPDLLGAAIEVGMGIAMGKKLVLYRPGRDSVFWYLPGVMTVWSKTEMLDTLKGDEVVELLRGADSRWEDRPQLG